MTPVKQLPNTRGKKATEILCLETLQVQDYFHNTKEEEYALGATLLPKSQSCHNSLSGILSPGKKGKQINTTLFLWITLTLGNL